MKDEILDCQVITQALKCLEQQSCLATGKKDSCECDFGYGHSSKDNTCQRCPPGTGTKDFQCQKCGYGELSMYRAVCLTPSECTNLNGQVNDKKQTCECPSGTFYDPTEGCINLIPDTNVNCSAITTQQKCTAQRTCKYSNGQCQCSPLFPVKSTITGGCNSCPDGQVYNTTHQCQVESVTDGWTISPSQTVIFEYTQCQTIDGYLASDVNTQCLCKKGLEYIPYKDACIVPLNLRKDAGSARFNVVGTFIILGVVAMIGIMLVLIRSTKKTKSIVISQSSEIIL